MNKGEIRPKDKETDEDTLGLPPQRLYVSRKEEGRGLTNIEDCVDTTIQGLREYTKKQRKTTYCSH